jgi:subtilase family serine protease
MITLTDNHSVWAWCSLNRIALVTISLLLSQWFPLFTAAADPLTPQTAVRPSHPGILLGHTDGSAQVPLTVSIKPSSQASIDAFVADLYNPHSANYRHFLTSQQYTQRFFNPADRKQVVTYLTQQGFVVHDTGIGQKIDVTASVEEVERAFHITLSDYRAATGQIYYANDLTPALPTTIRALIFDVFGLDNMPREAPDRSKQPAPAPTGRNSIASSLISDCSYIHLVKNNPNLYLPKQFAAAYHMDDLYSQGEGEGCVPKLL